jgi:hypothetical protein
MLRNTALLLLPAALCLAYPAPADAALRYPWPGAALRADRGFDLSGDYINTSNNGRCFVERRGRGYTFVNENGSRARFVFTGPRTLEQVSGEWDPSVVARVSRDRRGRTVIRFDSPNAPPGTWVSVD